MNQNKITLPRGGGLKRGSLHLPSGKKHYLKQGGGLGHGGGLTGIGNYIFDEEDDYYMFIPATASTPMSSASSSASSTPSASPTATPAGTPPSTPTGSPKLKPLEEKYEEEASEFDTQMKEFEAEFEYELLTKDEVEELLDELSDTEITTNSNKYQELRKRLAKLFAGKLAKPIPTGVIGLPKIADNATKIKHDIMAIIPEDLTPSKYKDQAKRQRSEHAPSSRLEVFNTLQTVGLTKTNYEDKLNNPAGKTSADKVKSMTDMRNTILDAFNVKKDTQIRSKILPAHSNAKKDPTLGETNNNDARLRLLKRDMIAYLKDNLGS
jgi:hypothetical protein